EIKRPVKRFNEDDTNADHHTAQDQRTQNTPEQHTVLVSSRDGEIGKDEDKNEDVIDAERIFHQVTGQKLQSFRVSFPMPDQCIESKRKRYPNGSPDRRFLRARRVCLALEAKLVDGQHAEHAGVKGDPEPEIRMHQIWDQATTGQFAARPLRW